MACGCKGNKPAPVVKPTTQINVTQPKVVTKK